MAMPSCVSIFSGKISLLCLSLVVNNLLLRTLWCDSICSIIISLKSFKFPYNSKALGNNFSECFSAHLSYSFARLPYTLSTVTVGLDLQMCSYAAYSLL